MKKVILSLVFLFFAIGLFIFSLNFRLNTPKTPRLSSRSSIWQTRLAAIDEAKKNGSDTYAFKISGLDPIAPLGNLKADK